MVLIPRFEAATAMKSFNPRIARESSPSLNYCKVTSGWPVILRTTKIPFNGLEKLSMSELAIIRSFRISKPNSL